MTRKLIALTLCAAFVCAVTLTGCGSKTVDVTTPQNAPNVKMPAMPPMPNPPKAPKAPAAGSTTQKKEAPAPAEGSK